jgi:DnaJ-class molecular chaperone
MIWVKCPDCGGDGTVEIRHPQWGSPTCPEAYINVPCSTCEGAGGEEYEPGDE